MKNWWKLSKLTSFEKIDLKGLGRWLLAGIVLDIIAGRMNMQPNKDIFELSGVGIPILICFGLYGRVYNRHTNLPQFTRELPYTSKQEVNRSIILLVGNFAGIVAIGVVVTVFYGLFKGNLMNNQINYGQVIRQVIFIFVYFLFMVALLFPLGMIRDKKKWYLAFAPIAVVTQTISLVFINLLPGDGKFKTAGMVFENPTMILNYDMVLGIMGVITILTLIASYIIAQKLHAPKRYV